MDNNQNNQNVDSSQYQYGQTGHQHNEQANQTGNQPPNYQQQGYQQQGYQQQGYQQPGYQQPGYQQSGYQQPGYQQPRYQQQNPQTAYNPNNKGPIGETRSPATVILLSIVTCGIYGIIWYFNVIREINNYSRNEYVSQGLMIGSIFCFPLIWLVNYKIDRALYEIDLAEGRIAENRFTLWLLLSFLAGVGTFMMMYQVQESLNRIWASNNSQYYNQPNF